ncbi:ribonuclease [Qipengyuania sediminis]|uniref:ribonuclease n=1 Tax=Qipengyuania sediminis TaxID=1532023 RepID=UPI001F0F6FC6|nr:ribonuclease [Qipengyuania sediminis]
MPDRGAEWLIEEGIGEHRAVLMERGRIAEARLVWPGQVLAGSVVEARLIARAAGSSRGTARTAQGEEILVTRLPRQAAEGAGLSVEITRAACEGPGRLKRAQGRPTDLPPRLLTLSEVLQSEGQVVTRLRRFPGQAWEELMAEVLAGEVAFAGGTLLFSPTPALTAIDVDGTIPPHPLALAAVPPLAASLRRFAIGGSAVIDFPTLAAKEDRRALDASLGVALAGWPHERTAVNGFGLVQIVARMEGPSLLQRAAWQRPALVWRQLLRRAEHLEGAGIISLAIHPALAAAARPGHIAELERRSGKPVRLRHEPGLDPDAPHAQLTGDER